MSTPRSNLGITGLGYCPLVLGECVQGQLAGGCHFLITSPLGIFSWAEFTPDPGLDEPVVEPAGCTKAQLAVQRFLGEVGVPSGGRLRVSTPIESGQGFGTSTADITASIRAAAAAWRYAVEPEEIARIAISIEPTDGSMYPGCVAFAHRAGLLLERLGNLPPWEALVLLTGGIVDTVEFDKVRKGFRYSRMENDQLLSAWHMVRRANRLGSFNLLARAATVSARINQRLLPKPFFAELLDFVARGGADGLMTAHSGTALALLLNPSRADHQERAMAAIELVSSLAVAGWFHLSSQQRFLGRRSRYEEPAVARIGAAL